MAQICIYITQSNQKLVSSTWYSIVKFAIICNFAIQVHLRALSKFSLVHSFSLAKDDENIKTQKWR